MQETELIAILDHYRFFFNKFSRTEHDSTNITIGSAKGMR
jgi:hypothetical protein